jgi:hypothetical protein
MKNKICKKCLSCGEEFFVCPSWIKRKFCSQKCYWQDMTKRKPWNYGIKDTKHMGPNSNHWKGGKYKMTSGYVVLTINGSKLCEHRVVMEKWLGRKLSSLEIVHHKDMNVENNDISNLELMDWGVHTSYHHKLRHSLLGVNNGK